jgi:hypothetical protein
VPVFTSYPTKTTRLEIQLTNIERTLAKLQETVQTNLSKEEFRVNSIKECFQKNNEMNIRERKEFLKKFDLRVHALEYRLIGLNKEIHDVQERLKDQ